MIFGLAIIIAIYLAAMVCVVQWKKDTSIANFTWGGGVMLVTLYTFFVARSFLPRHILITTLIIVWASRLALYVYLRYNGKDPRYQTWKNQGLLINFLYIFGLQLVMLLIMSIPSFLINKSHLSGLALLDFIGIIVWLVGFFFEAVSDYQLFEFTKNPANKGKLMKYGLWHYSRHPNYFGEVVMWWGIFLIALNVPYGYLALISAGTITFLLLFVTGIPWVEQALAKNPEYPEYKRTTSIFIPWFPKK